MIIIFPLLTMMVFFPLIMEGKGTISIHIEQKIMALMFIVLLPYIIPRRIP